MDGKLAVFLVISLVVLSVTLYGSLTVTVWKLTRENAVMARANADIANAVIKDNTDLKQRLKALEETRSLTKHDPHILKRVTRQARSTQTATEILADALNELIEKKLYTLMECNRNQDNQTDCSLKPGPKGDKGESGAQGKDGPIGHQGMKGDKGQHGYPGYKGDTGSQGPVGGRGPKGDMGAVGPKGEQGPAGPQGATGEMGARGEPGTKGEKGEHGYPGHKGSVGPKGEPGMTGPVGSKGDRGLQGERGQHGYPGYKGEKGMTGLQGPPGSTPVTTPTEPPETTTTEAVPSEQCGGPGWRRVVLLNMANPSHHCPQGLSLTSYPIRSCGKADGNLLSCYSVEYRVGSSPYSQVCGRAKAYRWGYSFAFFGHHIRGHDINNQYVDGLSLTHGSPRTHIWTFASGLFNGTSGDTHANYRCPCDEGNTYGTPPFVGNDYFCESVATVDNWNVNQYRFYPDNALWDGEGCQGTCCQHNNPPWFRQELPRSTSDDIELRMCLWHSATYSNIALTNLELYVY